MPKFYYETLASEKYYAAQEYERRSAEKRNRFREVMRTAMFGAGALVVLAVAICTMPVWVTGLIELLESYGW